MIYFNQFYKLSSPQNKNNKDELINISLYINKLIMLNHIEQYMKINETKQK